MDLKPAQQITYSNLTLKSQIRVSNTMPNPLNNPLDPVNHATKTGIKKIQKLTNIKPLFGILITSRLICYRYVL